MSGCRCARDGKVPTGIILVVIGLAALVVGQLLARTAWADRPAVHGAAAGNTEVVDVTEIFNELEPGEFAGTLLLGGMRGLVIDILWMRAARASDARRYYESVALYELISKVQPRFEIVWNHMAWHMAYNIAVEMDDPADRWSWFLAGVEANATGALRNPQSERILRHLAWLFFHKGEKFQGTIEDYDWRPLLTPILERFGRQDSLSPGANNFDIAIILYRCAMELALRRGLPQPANVQRLIPVGVEQSGNRRRNAGHPLDALMTYLEGIRVWKEVLDWAADERFHLPPEQIMFHMSSFEHNEGRLRRKAAHLARMLAPDDTIGAEIEQAVLERNFPVIQRLLATGVWRDGGRYGLRVRWYDEDPPQP